MLKVNKLILCVTINPSSDVFSENNFMLVDFSVTREPRVDRLQRNGPNNSDAVCKPVMLPYCFKKDESCSKNLSAEHFTELVI